jgi:Tol biopolymer transport system component
LFPGNGNGVWSLDLETRQSRRLSGGGLDTNPVFSPGGDRIAFERTEPGLDTTAQIWIMNADGTGPRPLTEAASVYEASQPAWSPDGSTVAYVEGGESGDAAGLVVIGVDGSPTRQLRTCVFGSCDRFPTFPVWSPDGGSIAVLLQHAQLARTDLAVVDTTSGDQRVVRELPFSASSLSWTASG